MSQTLLLHVVVLPVTVTRREQPTVMDKPQAHGYAVSRGYGSMAAGNRQQKTA